MTDELRTYILSDQNRGIKLRLNSPQESAEVQRELFKLGFSWGSRGQTVQFTNRRYLYCIKGIISRVFYTSNSERDYNYSDLREFLVDDVLNYDYYEYFHYKYRF